MAKTAQIVLGDLKFVAHPLNLGEIEDISEHIPNMTAGGMKLQFAALRMIVATAVRRDRPDFSDDDAKRIEAPPAAVRDAALRILEISGFTKAATPSGEAPAGAA